MGTVYHLDYESYSPQPLGSQKSVGAFRYASDPTAEILIMAIAKNDEEPLVWSVLDQDLDALMLLQEAVNSGAPIYAHNAQFEHAVSTYLFQKTFGIAAPRVEQWLCTAAMCRLAAIPSSLAEAGEFLGIDLPKDKEGKRLIQKFSVPRKATRKDPRTRIMPQDDPEDFQKFVDYCKRDVVAEQQIFNRLIKDFPLEGWALESFQADMRMNSRGIPVNREALEHALQLMEEFINKMVPLFRSQVAVPGGTQTLPVTGQRKEPKVVELDDGFNPSQREMMMVWMAERGYTEDNLRADTVEDWLEDPRDLTPEAQTALKTYSMVASAAVKKVPAMLNMACEDGFVRGALMVFGAERTHRWTGKGMQPQNFARPRINFTELAYQMICQKCTLDEIESVCGSYFDVLVSVIRHFIQPHDGDCLQADYSAIEARVAPWLVGEQATLDLFEQGVDLYVNMAGIIFSKESSQVVDAERFVGKQAILGCSYNMGRPKFRGTCESYGFTPPQDMVDEYKPRHQGVVRLMFSKFKSSKEREYANKYPNREFPNDTALMKLMIRSNNWHTVGITSDNVMQPETDEQWTHLTYDDLADRAVTAWRESNPVIVSAWRQLDVAAKEAIENPGLVTKVGKLAFRYQKVAGFPALLLKLPSGHKLVYPRAHVKKDTEKGWGSVVKFWGIIPNSGGKWGWCATYGGKLLENATQATAGDVMRNGMLAAEKKDYNAFMLVHDEILTLMSNPDQSHEELCELLCDEAGWMKGLPLAAEGGRLPFYKK